MAPSRGGFATIATPVASWRLSFSAAIAIAVAAAACAATPGERAVARGDLAALRLVVAEREKKGDLSNAEAARLARAVAEHDLRAASAADAVDLVHEVRPCARELDDALSARMAVHDEAGAQAALARIDGGGMQPEEAGAFGDDPDSAWRAVGARSLVRPEQHDARLRALVDRDPRVRREAARAALDAKSPADLDALAEAARVDPTPIVRTEAVRAIAAIPPPGIAGTVQALRDVWESADEGLREDIARAWAGAALWGAGGREALQVLVASQHGPAAVEGAAAVLRHRDANVAEVGAAVGQLERSIESGPIERRLQAIAQSPLDRPELLAAVRAAAESDDSEVGVGALARLLETKDGRVVERLEAMARPGSAVSGRARFALALASDRRVQAWVEQDLGAGSPDASLAAARELAAMGRAGRAAPLLADGDARVRLRAACTIITAARR